MKILITGAKGFIGKNLIAELNNISDGKTKRHAISGPLDIYPYDIDSDPALLDTYTKDCDFVFNLAGINRPQNPEAFMSGNLGFATTLLESLKDNHNTCPLMLSSSTQAALDNPYGKSKKAGEDTFFDYSQETGAAVYVYRFPNVFGKWCRPNYNSAVATFCHNIAHNQPITISDPSVVMHLVYIDDVVDELIRCLSGGAHQNGPFAEVPVVYTITLGDIADTIKSFRTTRETLEVPNMADPFTKKLYATYLSYLPTDAFSYPLKMNSDHRGSFTEFIRTEERGQVSINISKPGITKGNHWHHTKNEKFLVVKGKGHIQFRQIHSEDIISYHVTGDTLEVIDIPTGYTHTIINEGDEDMVTVMWANEAFDPDKPDTYFLEV